MLLVLLLSLWPRKTAYQQSGEQAEGLYPQEGDNFKQANHPTVYRLENGKRRPYRSSASYFADSSNPPYARPYEEGGILVCDSATVLTIPMGMDMPLSPEEIESQYNWKSFVQRDKLTHFIIYTCLALLLCWVGVHKNKMLFQQYLGFFLLLSVFGLGIEILQAYCSETRSFEPADLIMNSLGVGIGLFLFHLFVLKGKHRGQFNQ